MTDVLSLEKRAQVVVVADHGADDEDDDHAQRDRASNEHLVTPTG
jgi:hypothetical protein